MTSATRPVAVVFGGHLSAQAVFSLTGNLEYGSLVEII
ncbi:hypothetical protein AQPE_1730 [Aquipluma nitroreducens]|uniref:Uncharacterized protein n=1 Tax=Aquipluma nitroreducens TaxID=2010828 RepID=A0A5K7S8C8_9BACT|nr:hypothetical protein AQPE_1730 [Aquipluma nitroreducens]